MSKRFKFAVVVPNNVFGRIECIDREEAHFEVKRLLNNNPDAVWAIEELDDTEGPFVTWSDYETADMYDLRRYTPSLRRADNFA